MTLCTSIDTLAMAYLDDELADEELRDLELHIIDCAACRGRVETERDSLAELRRRLAPPPMPDVVRARLRAAIAAEDRATAQRSLRGRLAGWALPGAASLVAVAALALFVTMRQGDSVARDPVAAAVVGQRMDSLQVNVPRPAVDRSGGSEGQLDVFRAASWQEQFQGRTVTQQVYVVTLPWGGQVQVQASVFDARGLDLDDGQRVMSGGYDLHVVSTRTGQYAVSYVTPDGVGYVFIAPELSAQDLVDLVGGYLIDRVGAKMHD